MIETPNWLRKLTTDPKADNPTSPTSAPEKSEAVFANPTDVIEEVKRQLALNNTSVTLQLADGVWEAELQKMLTDIPKVRYVGRVGSQLTVTI